MKNVFLVLAMMVVLATGQTWAKDGWYVGMDVGFAVAPGIDMDIMDNDFGTRCDKIINPGQIAWPNTPLTPEDCPENAGDAWSNALDGGMGFLAGLALGYRLGDFRVEGEYFYRGTTYDSESDSNLSGPPQTTTKAQQEVEEVKGAIDDVLSHNFFANLYYDYHSGSKFTPYVGVGLGVAQVSLDWYNRWKRNDDPQYITTFCESGPSNCDADLNAKLAGTTSVTNANLSDLLFGYQVLAGVDYQISDPMTIGLKFRWADFGEFEDGEEWEQLRSHESTNSLDPNDSPRNRRVQYALMTDDIQFWGISLNMKYQF